MVNLKQLMTNKLKLSYIGVYLISLLALNQIYHLERVYNLFFSNIIPSLNFDPLTKTFIIILMYSIVFIIGYILLFSKTGLKISDNKYFTLTLICIILLFSFTITLEHNQTIDFNSDNDAALNLWIGNILNSTFPYEGVTQLGNSISDLPFLPIYSLPFYLIGNVGWQNIINVIIILFVLWKFTNTRKQLNFALMSLLISVPFFIFLFIHSDHITVAALALLGIYLLNEKRLQSGSLLFSLLIASKAYIWLFIPTTLYYISKNGNKSDLKKTIILYILIPSILIIPFILWNPVYFFTTAPIGVDAAHLNYFPFSEYIITIGVMLISLYS